VVRVHSMSVVYETDGTVKDEDVLLATSVADEAAAASTMFVLKRADLNTPLPKKLWELAGDTSDPGGYYYVASYF
jgi:hypothetical protein